MSTVTMFDRNPGRRYSSSRTARVTQDESSQQLTTKAVGARDTRPRQRAVAVESVERNARGAMQVAIESLAGWGLLLAAGVVSLCLLGLLASSFYSALAGFSPLDVVRGMGGMN